MLDVEAAQQRILAAVSPLGSETIPLADAIGRILTVRTLAAVELPGFDNSAMDGYAVRSSDVGTASAERSARLRVIGRCAAGETFSQSIQAGECVRIFTGSVMPPGADAVVMQEDVRVDAADPAVVHVVDSVKPWENIRFRGEDVKSGSTLIEAGARLTVGRLSLLAATGVAEARVGRRPRVGIVATGSELREPGSALQSGQLYESNRLGLSVLARRAGALAKVYPLVPDNLAATQNALQNALDENDVVVTSGGVSVGEFDFVKEAFEKLGGKLEFWRIAIKPGKPFVFGRWREKLLFGLPGNPVSGLVGFCVFVAPALARMQGASDLGFSHSHGVLAEPLENRGDRPHYMRVSIDSKAEVRSTGVQASHILSSLAEADGLLCVPARTLWETGRAVKVLRWD